MITLKVKTLRTPDEQIIGLIGADPICPVSLTTRFGIHTFGVRTPIDILILDSHNVVVRLKKHLAPNRVFFWSPLYFRVIELPGGTITKKGIQMGSKIILEEQVLS
jgi:uncharacterized protein